MSSPAAATASPESIVADFERRARRCETPCGDGTLVWRAWGTGAPLLLLHGAQGSWAHWIRNIDYLAGFRQVWAPDLPGFGESAPPPRAGDGTSFAEAIATGLRQLVEKDLPIDVVGFSMGGVLGGHLAAIAPEIVRRLILVNVGGLGTPHGHISMVPLRGLEGEARLAARRANLLGLMIHEPDNVDDLALFIQTRSPTRVKIDAAQIVLPDKLLQALAHVPGQVDAIWSEHDRPHPDPELHRSVLSRIQPDIDFRVIPGVGHWSMYEGAETFNPMLHAMLDQPLRTRKSG